MIVWSHRINIDRCDERFVQLSNSIYQILTAFSTKEPPHSALQDQWQIGLSAEFYLVQGSLFPPYSTLKERFLSSCWDVYWSRCWIVHRHHKSIPWSLGNISDSFMDFFSSNMWYLSPNYEHSLWNTDEIASGHLDDTVPPDKILIYASSLGFRVRCCCTIHTWLIDVSNSNR